MTLEQEVRLALQNAGLDDVTSLLRLWDNDSEAMKVTSPNRRTRNRVKKALETAGFEVFDRPPTKPFEAVSEVRRKEEEKPQKQLSHLRVNLNDDGTAHYYRWIWFDEEDGAYDFSTFVPPREAMKMIAEGCTLEITALDPDNNDRVFSNLNGGLKLEEN